MVSMPGQLAQGRVPAKVPAKPFMSKPAASSEDRGASGGSSSGSAARGGAVVPAASAAVATDRSVSWSAEPQAVMVSAARRAEGISRSCIGGSFARGFSGSAAAAAEQPAQQAADDLPPDLAANGTRGLLGHGLDHALSAPGTEYRIADGTPDATFVGVVLARGRGLDLFGDLLGATGQDFLGGLAVYGLVVLRADRAAGTHGGALLVGDRAHAAPRRGDEGVFDRHRHGLVLEGGDQRLAGAQGPQGGDGVQVRVGHEGLGRRAQGLLVARGEGAQRMLDAVAELPEDLVGHVVGVL